MAIQDVASSSEAREANRSLTPGPSGAATTLPPLENGDRLTRAEFERRYEAMPGLKKAELVEGVVYVPSPVRYTQHGHPNLSVDTWLGVYMAATPGVGGAGNATVRLDLDNEPQPDILLRIEHDGRSSVSEDGYVEGPPELVVEVAASSASYDLHDKLRAYRRNGVQEYVVWRVLDDALDWLILREGAYEPLTPDDAGILRSEVFPGLWLAVNALLTKDLAGVLAMLQQGLASPDHAAFVARLHEAPSAATPPLEQPEG
jgi:Uma2 family endonuclease